jgi:hypothetical protein
MNLRIIQKWLTAVAENSSQLFSRKPWLNNVASGRSSGSTPFPAFPLAQWLWRKWSRRGEMVYTATGIAPEWNRTSLLMNFVCTIFNRNAKQRYGIGNCMDDEDVHILWIPEKSMGNFPPSALFIIFNP